MLVTLSVIESSKVAKYISLACVLDISSPTSCHCSLKVVLALINDVFLLSNLYSVAPGATQSTRLVSLAVSNTPVPTHPCVSNAIPIPMQINSLMYLDSFTALDLRLCFFETR